MKICNKCSLSKELNNYTRDARNKDGLQGICRPCKNSTNKAYRDQLKISKPIKVVFLKNHKHFVLL